MSRQTQTIDNLAIEKTVARPVGARISRCVARLHPNILPHYGHLTSFDGAFSPSEKAAMSLLLKITAFALCAYAAVVLAAYLGQRRLMYFPDRERVRPVDEELANVVEQTLKTPDGARLIAWFGKAKPGNPTILYFHGNAGGLADRAPRIQRFMDQGWGVYMLAYRSSQAAPAIPPRRPMSRIHAWPTALLCWRASIPPQSSSMGSHWAPGWRSASPPRTGGRPDPRRTLHVDR